jgi:hypothetical protein
MSTKDVFVWRMSAEIHRSAILAFRREIIDHYTAKTPFPIALISFLLPIKSDQLKELNDRGSFTIDGDNFSNSYSDETTVTVDDPTMKQFDVVVPEKWQGTISVKGKDIKIEFNPSIELRVPRLSELGIGRSQFQLYSSMEGDEKLISSRLVDKVDNTKETIIEVELEADAASNQRLLEDATKLAVFDAAVLSCSSSNPNDPVWHVWRHQGGLCFVGRIVTGSDPYDIPNYDHMFGPDTQRAADAWQEIHCVGGISC